MGFEAIVLAVERVLVEAKVDGPDLGGGEGGEFRAGGILTAGAAPGAMLGRAPPLEDGQEEVYMFFISSTTRTSSPQHNASLYVSSTAHLCHDYVSSTAHLCHDCI